MSNEFVPVPGPDDSGTEFLGDPASFIYCIVGLGNPGTRYDGTPHNIGFAILDELAERHRIRISHNEGVALTGSGRIKSKDVVLVKPQGFMNNSGSGVRAVLKSRTLTNRDLIIVHDELDLPWTGVRIKKKGSAAGHNGVKSIIAALKSDYFTRLRVGIRPRDPIDDAAMYVLAPFGAEMKEDVSEVVSYTADAVEAIVAEGAIRAMTKFNRRARGIQDEEE
jgi:peptidyl-tRNA hydrolase, PTH1 family